MESGRDLALRVNVNKGEFGIWNDTVYVNYRLADGENRLLEDDIITLWGTVKGLKNYRSIFGATITIPEIDAKYIDVISHDK